ncbi:hypothetical protein OE059_07440 [Exiguobacterium profundum]|uniref:Uncharacterized protein n=1 Tax=Exiguobacterium profundum TaxID=307643 RepID=A0ABY8B407_9BACL|nr:hypothetical protein [Exiguobacterium profundum]WED56675.1 hypothetical protein OE059_07440 [Exiguobacterium profundum]
MKRIFLFICCIGLLTGCDDEQMDVVKLDYISEHWNVKEMNSGRMDAKSETWASDLLDACSGNAISRIEEDVTVYRSYELNRKFDDAYKIVMYMEGDRPYAVCYDSASEQIRAEEIDEFPHFVHTEEGTDILSTPTIRTGTHEELKQMEQKDQGHYYPMPVRLLEGTMIHVTPSLYGQIDLTIGDQQGLFPISHLEPFSAQSEEVGIALGYDEQSKEAYFYYEKEDGLTTLLPLVVWNEKEHKHEPIQFEGLQVEQVLREDILEPGVKTPLYTFSFIEDGKRVNEEVSLTYLNGEFSTHDPVQNASDSNGPFVYVHEKPLNGALDIQYPNVLMAEENDISDLMNAIDDAIPVKRAGDLTDYSRLTIVDGWGAQEFQLSFKKRSQKIDVYLTDSLRDQTFKLSSKGAERFLDLFPEVKES